MTIIESGESLQKITNQFALTGKKAGFVPTMGALHSGHSSLVDRSVAENQTTIVSIFVNPTQFNDPRDLDKYPRTLEADCALLEKHGCDYVFCPSVEEMYPKNMDLINLDLGELATVMEGRFRKGHFQGMVTIVYKLFNLIKPYQAYFGEKDFQQLALIRYMVKRLEMPVTIIGCETIREPDGLALSSRNIHLTAEERRVAAVIYKSMNRFAALKNTLSVQQVCSRVIDTIEKTRLFEVEYFQIVNANTLAEVDHWQAASILRACIAVKTSRTRLIDNIPV